MRVRVNESRHDRRTVGIVQRRTRRARENCLVRPDRDDPAGPVPRYCLRDGMGLSQGENAGVDEHRKAGNCSGPGLRFAGRRMGQGQQCDGKE